MSFDNDLHDTLASVRALEAIRPDNLEDYYHDAIVHELRKGREIHKWLGYIYQCVSKRIGRGREGPIDISLDENITLFNRRTSIDLELDMKYALGTLTYKQALYIYNYYYEGYTLEEIALANYVSMKSVDFCIQRGLQRLRQVLSCYA